VGPFFENRLCYRLSCVKRPWLLITLIYRKACLRLEVGKAFYMLTASLLAIAFHVTAGNWISPNLVDACEDDSARL
jgi:hypothetical protein